MTSDDSIIYKIPGLGGSIAMERPELVLIPLSAMGHLASAVEIAKRLVDLDQRLSVTVLFIKSPFDPRGSAYIDSLVAPSINSSSSGDGRIRYLNLPLDASLTQLVTSTSPANFFTHYIDYCKNQVREAVANRFSSADSNANSSVGRLAGFVFDMMFMPIMEVARELGVPSYAFFTSGASFLGLMLYYLAITTQDTAELAVPTVSNPVPARLLHFKDDEGSGFFVSIAKSLREAKGILVNSFMELEPYAISSLAADTTIPSIYAVGPILNLEQVDARNSSENADIVEWLDRQPPSSVVFLCFGSRGCFREEQVREIANGLERSGHRFLWSLRRPPPMGEFAPPSDYANLKEVLPEGFVDRTGEIGRVIGWAPQVAVLSHPAVGAFVSHCGWNSILESVWCGVPIATWPMYAEQQMNAFLMVRELRLAAEITLDYRYDFKTEPSCVIGSEEIERRIKWVMEEGREVRERAKEMREKSRNAVMDGGSSHSSLRRFIDDVIQMNGAK